MNNFLKVSLFIGLFLSIGGWANAQSKSEWMEKPAEERAQIITDWMTEELSLKDDQKSDTYDINLKYAKKGDELKAASGSKMSKFKKMKAYGEDKDAELKKVFTDEQYQAYQDKKKDMRDKMKE